MQVENYKGMEFYILQVNNMEKSKFIYCFNHDDYLKMINLGFTFICKCNLGKECYVFNNDKRILTFSQEDKRNLLFTNKMYF